MLRVIKGGLDFQGPAPSTEETVSVELVSTDEGLVSVAVALGRLLARQPNIEETA